MPPPAVPTEGSFEERWKPRRRTIALFGIVTTLVLWLGNACRPCYIGAGSVDRSIGFAGTTRHGIRLWAADSPPKTVFLLSRAGERLDGSSWAVQNEELWYWSVDDKSLCRVSASGKRQFVPVKIPSQTVVARLQATSEGFLLNLSSTGSSTPRQNPGDSAGVLYVPANDPGKSKLLPGLQEARGNETSKKFCGRDVKGDLTLWPDADGPTQRLAQNGAGWKYWDYAPAAGRITFVRGNEVGVLEKDQVLWTRSSGGAFWFYGVGFAPNGDVWASEEAMAHTGGVAVLAADTGKLRGWRAKYPGPLRSPFHEVDTKLAALLGKLPQRQ